MTSPSFVPVPPQGCPAHQAAPLPASEMRKLYGDHFAVDPNATYDWLRSHGGPVQPVELAPGVDALLVVGYHAALEVLRSPYFSKDARRWKALYDGRVPPDSPVLPIMGYRHSLWFADGQEHMRLRAPVDYALGGINPHTLRTFVQRSAGQLIDQFAPHGTADLVAQYAAPIPLMVLAQLFGCPDHLRDRISAAFLAMVNAVEPAAAQQGLQDLVRALTELIAIKRQSPGDDVITRLLQYSGSVSQEELIDQLVVITGAGQVPGTAWISTATMMLLSDERFARGLTGGSLTVSDALNEVLWLHAPHSNYSFVYAIQDYTLRDPNTGHESRIPAGVPVVISHAGANLDPAMPTNQEQRAANTAHLAFSAGPHACPAQDASRIIAEVAVDVLLDRLPDMRLALPAEDLTWRPGPFIRGLTALPVEFSVLSATQSSPAAQTPPATNHAFAGASSWHQGPAQAQAQAPAQQPAQAYQAWPAAPAAQLPAEPPRRGWSFLGGSKRGR